MPQGAFAVQQYQHSTEVFDLEQANTEQRVEAGLPANPDFRCMGFATIEAHYGATWLAPPPEATEHDHDARK